MRYKKLCSLVLAMLFAVSFLVDPSLAADEDILADELANEITKRQLVDIQVASNHSVALAADGSVWTWGSNQKGQLGNGYAGDDAEHSFVEVSGLGNIVQVAAGGNHSVALSSDGTVWCWGSNNAGQLGDRTTVDRYEPVQVAGLYDVVEIIASTSNTYALKSDGTVYSWGSRHLGYLGDGGATSGTQSTPVRVKDLNGVQGIFAGYSSYYALKDDGSLWAWGYNYGGKLGINSQVNSINTPQLVKQLRNVKKVVANQDCVAALQEDGSVWYWGDYLSNMYWQPQQMLGLPLIQDLAFNGSSFLCKDLDDVWWFTGRSGSSGDPTLVGSLLDTSVQTKHEFLTILSPVQGASTGYLGIGYDGSVWAWGNNKRDRISPLLENIVHYEPIQIFKPGTWYGSEPIDPPVQHTVTLTEHWADDAQPDIVTPFQAEDGDPLTIPFNTPAGYTATAEVDDDVVVDYDVGTLTIPSVTEDRELKLIYTPEAQIEGHTVTIVEHYLDGVLPDRSHTYTVPDGGTLVADYEILPNYGVDSSIMRAAVPSYFVDEYTQTVRVRNVDRDLTVTLNFHRTAFVVTVTEQYEDGAQADRVRTFTVDRGADFLANYEVLDGYRVVDIESDPLGFLVRYTDQTIRYEDVQQDMYITLTFGE